MLLEVFTIFGMLGNNNKRYSLKSTSAFKNTTASHDCFSRIIKRLQNRCFFVNIANFLITVFFIKHLRWLLLSSFYYVSFRLNFFSEVNYFFSERIYLGRIFWFFIICRFFELFFNCRPTGWLYSPAHLRNSRFNKSPNFQTLQLFSIYMMK